MSACPTPVNVRVAVLRRRGINSFEEWLARDDSVYVGRHVVHVKGTFDSDWGNYKYATPEKYASDLESLRPDLILRLKELEGKEIGCWCVPDKPCHAEALCQLFKKHVLKEE